MNKLLIFSGAGISAESGLSTFRDVDGLWKRYNIDEVCNFINFKKHKEDDEKRTVLFKFYNDVKKAILKAEPNEAHYQVAKWQKKYGTERVIITTANIDNLFEKAGCENVIHVHGEIFNMHCAACQNKWYIGESEYKNVRCNKCNSRLTKPNIVFFHEQAPEYEKLQYYFHPKRRQEDDILLYIGSSMSVIHPTTLFGTGKNSQLGTRVLINKEKSNDDYLFQEKYYGLATKMLKKVDEDLVAKQMK
jgi:NAD-dependent deacetylase